MFLDRMTFVIWAYTTLLLVGGLVYTLLEFRRAESRPRKIRAGVGVAPREVRGER